MPSGEQVLSAQQVASALLFAVLAGRLVRYRLHGRYRFFFLFLIFDLARTITSLSLSLRSDAYAIFYMVSTATSWVLYVLVLWEVYRYVLADHPGIARFGRWIIGLALAAATLVSAWSTHADLANPAEPYVQLRVFFTTHRVVISVLLFLLAVVAFFLVWFPVRLRRNIVSYGIGFSLYFLSIAGSVLARNVAGPQSAVTVNNTLMLLGNITILYWIWQLNPAGEARQVTVGHRWNPAEAERLVGQLDAINAALLRVARK